MDNSKKNILYRSDCKEALQKLLDKHIQVDLIYLDPPFNSNRTYNFIYRKEDKVNAQQKAFHDMWSLTSQNQQLLIEFENILKHTQGISQLVKDFLQAWLKPLQQGDVEDQKMLIYLIYMTERLVLMRDILKDTGSIYFHCDPTSSHYIKVIMDGIFGRENFRNEIVWSYRTGGSSKRNFAKKHDIILFYSKKNTAYYFNSQKEKAYTKSKSRKPGIINYGAGKAEFFQDEEGVFNFVIMRDIWDIPYLNSQSKERKGYPTQKPVALLDRIIKASCPEGGIVLDPFCGCGTTIASAIENEVNWIGVDISYDATNVIRERITDQISPTNFKSICDFIDGSPETREEYEKLDPYQKQDWLIQKLGGFPNQKKSGDSGVDGDLVIHLGTEKKEDIWGKVIFSVKTGKQHKPEMIRELIGTIKDKSGDIGILILDADPTPKMEELAQRQGQITYEYNKKLPPNYYDKIQIITAQQIIDGLTLHQFVPPTINDIRNYRSQKQLTLST